jgi:osmotically-inducible protein OsmY
LLGDPRLDEAAIDVTDENGLVTLKGQAPSDEARRAAGEIAKSQTGVIQVINDLTVGARDDGKDIENPAPAVLAGDEEQTGVTDTLP